MIIGILRGNNSNHIHKETHKALYAKDLLLMKYFHWLQIQFVYVFLDDFQSEEQVFTTSWKYDYTWGIFVDLHAPCDPSIIWNMLTEHNYYVYDKLFHFKIICSAHLSHICNNKYTTYKFLWDYQSNTTLLSSFYEFEKLQQEYSEEVVLKPIYWSKGSGVCKIAKKVLLQDKEKWNHLWKLYIVQQMIDSSKWYPWVSNTIHDLRIYMVGTNPVDAVVREKWDLEDFRVSVDLGWKATAIDIKNIPSDLLVICIEISDILLSEPTDFYSLDFMYAHNEKRRLLIEANSAPGFRKEGKLETIYDSIILQEIQKALAAIK